MNYYDVQSLLKTSSAIKLMRIDNAPLVISFLYNRFKSADKITISFAELEEGLNDYVDELNETSDTNYSPNGSTYIKKWIEDGFLRNYFDEEKDGFVVELTPDTEKAFSWLDELFSSESEFVGTESRFLLIFKLLKEIVLESTIDPEVKVKELEQQKVRLENEIERIKEQGIGRTFTSTQIKERYFLVKKQTRELLSDFRQVEENLRKITGEIQNRYLVENLNKGEIVNYFLESDDELRDSDQGSSFFTFWHFLRSCGQQDELQDLIEKTFNIPEIMQLKDDDKLLRKIKRYLLNSGEKVQKSTRKMSEQIRKVLDEQTAVENRRVFELTKEIKKWALENVDNHPEEKDFIYIEGCPDVLLIMDRPLWKSNRSLTFHSEQLVSDEEPLNDDDLKNLLMQSHVDIVELKRNVQNLLKYQKEVILPDVVEKFPVQKGLEEIVCYVQLANEDENHIVDDEIEDRVQYKRKEDGRVETIYVRVPRVTYRI